MEVVWERPFRGASVGGVVSTPLGEAVSERSWDEKQHMRSAKVRGSLDPVDRGSFRFELIRNGFEAEDREGYEREIRRTLKDP